jgi:catechol 2,3-dioxygenase-like lactoylglutathione lyase family enzyme
MTGTPPLRVRFHHVSLSVADLAAQRRWYAEALGFTEVIEQFELPEPPVRTAVLESASGVRVELIERAGSARARVFGDPLDTLRGQGYGHWALAVDDLDAAFARLTGSGAKQSGLRPTPSSRARGSPTSRTPRETSSSSSSRRPAPRRSSG